MKKKKKKRKEIASLFNSLEDVRAKGVFNANVMKVLALALRCRPVTHFEKQ